MDSKVPTKVEWVQSHKAENDQLSFLDLPRELRDVVYQYAFEISGAVFIYSSDPYHVRRNARAAVVRSKNEGPVEPQSIGKVIPVALVRICRQIHSECITILYGRNTFRLYASNTDFAPRYRFLVRQIEFLTDSMMRKIFDDDLETVGYWWRRHFWPDIVAKSTRLLETFPQLESLTFQIKSSRHGETWRPVFMAYDQKTRQQRIAIGATWLKTKCPFADERLRECLGLEIIASGAPHNDAYQGSRFEPEDEWDCSEFTEAFEKMKVL